MPQLLITLGSLGVLFGLFAFLVPQTFFDWFAAYTGQPNVHLVRDVGAAYVSAGIAISWASFETERRAPLISVAAVFLLLHAIGHVSDLLTGSASAGHVFVDIVLVFLPAIIVTYLAATSLRSELNGR